MPKDFVKSKSSFLNRDDKFYQDYFSQKYVFKFWECYAVNIGTKKHPVYSQICDYVVKGRKRSFSLDPIVGRLDKSLSYTLKYNFKQSYTIPIPDFIYGTSDAVKFYNTVRNKILMSRGFHNWVYQFIDSPVCKWQYSDFYDMVYPHFCLPNVFKPLSIRSFRRVCTYEVYEHILSHLELQPYDRASFMLRIYKTL